MGFSGFSSSWNTHPPSCQALCYFSSSLAIRFEPMAADGQSYLSLRVTCPGYALTNSSPACFFFPTRQFHSPCRTCTRGYYDVCLPHPCHHLILQQTDLLCHSIVTCRVVKCTPFEKVGHVKIDSMLLLTWKEATSTWEGPSTPISQHYHHSSYCGSFAPRCLHFSVFRIYYQPVSLLTPV